MNKLDLTWQQIDEANYRANRIFCNILNVFIVTFNQFNVSLLNKIINKKINKKNTDPKQHLIGSVYITNNKIPKNTEEGKWKSTMKTTNRNRCKPSQQHKSCFKPLIRLSLQYLLSIDWGFPNITGVWLAGCVAQAACGSIAADIKSQWGG